MRKPFRSLMILTSFIASSSAWATIELGKLSLGRTSSSNGISTHFKTCPSPDNAPVRAIQISADYADAEIDSITVHLKKGGYRYIPLRTRIAAGTFSPWIEISADEPICLSGAKIRGRSAGLASFIHSRVTVWGIE